MLIKFLVAVVIFFLLVTIPWPLLLVGAIAWSIAALIMGEKKNQTNPKFIHPNPKKGKF